jgi:hypothetical protein|tara:strand:+ start:117 stop:356 length:240 start_codon:yes stop_codon:yes gene_type:complete
MLRWLIDAFYIEPYIYEETNLEQKTANIKQRIAVIQNDLAASTNARSIQKNYIPPTNQEKVASSRLGSDALKAKLKGLK